MLRKVYIEGIKIPYLLFANDLVLMSESPTGLQNLMHGLDFFARNGTWLLISLKLRLLSLTAN